MGRLLITPEEKNTLVQSKEETWFKDILAPPSTSYVT